MNFACNYAIAYWGSIGLLLAIGIVLDPTLVGPNSLFGPMLEMFQPIELPETSIWLGHAWGIMILSTLGNYLTDNDTPKSIKDRIFVRFMMIVTIAWYPLCFYAVYNNYGFFWKMFPPIGIFNGYVYVSALQSSIDANIKVIRKNK